MKKKNENGGKDEERRKTEKKWKSVKRCGENKNMKRENESVKRWSEKIEAKMKK